MTLWLEQAGLANLWEVLIPWHHLHSNDRWNINKRIHGTDLVCDDFTKILSDPEACIWKMPDRCVFKHFLHCIDEKWLDVLEKECKVVFLERNPLDVIVSHFQASVANAWQHGSYRSDSVRLPEKWCHEMMAFYQSGIKYIPRAKQIAFVHVKYTEIEKNAGNAIAKILRPLGLKRNGEAPLKKQGRGNHMRRIKNLSDVKKWLHDYPELESYVNGFE